MKTIQWFNRACRIALLSMLLAVAVPPVMAQDDEDYELPWKNLQALDYTSSVELGIGRVNDDSIKFGEYNGLDTATTFVVGNLSIFRGGEYDDGDARYWRITAEDIGIDSRRFHGEYGEQSHYSAWFSFREMPKVEWLNRGARTPYTFKTAANISALPTAWAQMPYADSLLHPADLTYERFNYELGFAWNITGNWSAGAELSRENKEGRKSTGMYRPLLLVEEPLDYETDKASIWLGYNSTKYQTEIRYKWEDFTNHYPDLRIDSIQLDLPPSNSYQQISWNGALRLGRTSRLQAAFSRGTRTQNVPFLPFSTNPALQAPLPRNSLDGELDVTHASARFTTRPIRNLNLLASFGYDKRDNQTPMATYNYVLIDLFPREDRINLPYSFETIKYAFQGKYRLHRGLKVTAGVRRKELERSPFSEVERNTEHSFWGELDWSPSYLFQAGIKAEKSERDGSAYIYDIQHFASRPAGTSTATGRNPEMRHFNKADRDRSRLVLNAVVRPLQTLDIGLTVDYASDNYDKSHYGLQDKRIESYNLDLNYRPNNKLNIYAFMSRMNIISEQANSGHDHDESWSLEMEDESDMYGAGFKWEAVRNRLDIKGDLNHFDSGTDFNQNPVTVVTDPATGNEINLHLPFSNRRTDFNLLAEYHYRVDLSFRFEYEYLRYKAVDYALDGITVGTNASRGDIIFGSRSPNDSVHGFRLSAVKRF